MLIDYINNIRKAIEAFAISNNIEMLRREIRG